MTKEEYENLTEEELESIDEYYKCLDKIHLPKLPKNYETKKQEGNKRNKTIFERN